jgi:hypothetical protein
VLPRLDKLTATGIETKEESTRYVRKVLLGELDDVAAWLQHRSVLNTLVGFAMHSCPVLTDRRFGSIDLLHRAFPAEVVARASGWPKMGQLNRR